MNKEEIVLAVLIGLFAFLTIYTEGDARTNGDMNHDGILNITDLSILASIINEQG